MYSNLSQVVEVLKGLLIQGINHLKEMKGHIEKYMLAYTVPQKQDLANDIPDHNMVAELNPPTIEYASDGSKYWFTVDGLYVEYKDGTKCWYVDGKRRSIQLDISDELSIIET